MSDKSNKGFGAAASTRKKGGLEKHIYSKAKGSRKSSDWYRKNVFEYLYENITDRIELGKIYFFEYDPKYKDTLPIYDIYPIAFPIKMHKDGFLAHNLHYAPKKIRGDLAVSLLNSKAKLPTETLHSYLFKNADRIFFEVKKEDWEFISSLPLEKFIEK